MFIDISIIWGRRGGGLLIYQLLGGGGGVVIDISIFGAFEPKPLLRKIELKVALRKLPFVIFKMAKSTVSGRHP